MDGQTAETWSKVLAEFCDANIYQSWAYGAVRWGEKNLSHLVARQNGRIVAAAQLRIVRVPLLPTGIAYLRWGPLCQRNGDQLEPSNLAGMIASLGAEYCVRRRMALKIIPHAFLDDTRGDAYAAALGLARMQVEPDGSHYQTVLVNLSESPEIMRKQLDQKWRNQLNRSEKNGLVLETSDGEEAYRTFVELYEGMLERKQFATSVDVHEFDRMQKFLVGPARMQTFLAKKDGQPVGALVCSLMGNSAIYLLGATNEAARELKAAYFLQWQAMLWLKQQGARSYDLGGIDPIANPGGYHFKSGFGGKEATQLPTYLRTDGLLGRMVLRAVAWQRQRKGSSRSSALANS